MTFFFKYLVVPIIIILPRMEQKLLLDERATMLVGGYATPDLELQQKLEVHKVIAVITVFFLAPDRST